MNIQKIITRAALALLPIWAAHQATASTDYPNKPIRIVVAYAPGGQPTSWQDFSRKSLAPSWASLY